MTYMRTLGYITSYYTGIKHAVHHFLRCQRPDEQWHLQSRLLLSLDPRSHDHAAPSAESLTRSVYDSLGLLFNLGLTSQFLKLEIPNQDKQDGSNFC
jgi:hypothetical protein